MSHPTAPLAFAAAIAVTGAVLLLAGARLRLLLAGLCRAGGPVAIAAEELGGGLLDGQ